MSQTKESIPEPAILMVTLGTTWQIVPEILGLTNPGLVDLFMHHPDIPSINRARESFNIDPVDEVWMISTSGPYVNKSLADLRQWYDLLDPGSRPSLKIWQTEGMDDLVTEEDCRRMSEAIHTLVLHAREQSSRLYLSLAGGRKTMGSDLQNAAVWFGCDALIHVTDHGEKMRELNAYKWGADRFMAPLPREYGNLFTPVVVGRYAPSPLLDIPLKEGSYTVVGDSFPIVPFFPVDGHIRDDVKHQDDGQFRNDVKNQYDREIRDEGCLQGEGHLNGPGGEREKEISSPAGTRQEFILPISGEFPLTTALDDRRRDAGYLMCNYTNTMLQGETVTSFLALYSLPSADIEKLKRWKLGLDPAKEKEELRFLRMLPKAELHCHLGGIAHVRELIRIAGAASGDIKKHLPLLQPWLHELSPLVDARDIDGIGRKTGPLKGIRRAVSGVPGSVCTAAFIMLFKDNPDLLEKLIYRDLLDPALFCQVEFPAYERLGDLQGSGLLCHPGCLGEACRVVAENAIAHNVRYLEVRCSPINYETGDLSGEEVYSIIQSTLGEYYPELTCSVIFIASRHGSMENVHRHVELARKIIAREGDDPSSTVMLRGFDLAGDEKACRAADMQGPLMPLMEACLHFTIHAGENHSVQSIWEAVYHLNAERIGHCLTLEEHPGLMERFLDRNIVLEMCPSSNFQIIGYRDAYIEGSMQMPCYPLKKYLDAGLRVTVNSDNPGISRTDFTAELHRACRLTPGGLSMWEILSIVRNSFKASFAKRSLRHRILREAERDVLVCLRLNNCPPYPDPNPL
ncbi:MAG: hypothetical protein HQK66_14140 [Desulfamplus sp.]|nr:hypothetical protein [Desulfamplus sp.]